MSLVPAPLSGHGLQCQRAVAAICELVGIRDLRAKIIGSSNPMNIVQATFEALKSQVRPVGFDTITCEACLVLYAYIDYDTMKEDLSFSLGHVRSL